MVVKLRRIAGLPKKGEGEKEKELKIKIPEGGTLATHG